MRTKNFFYINHFLRIIIAYICYNINVIIMKKKKLLIVLIMLVVITGCGKKLDKKIVEKQEIVVNNLGVSNDNYFVYNKDNRYYIYFVSETNYTGYLYTLHKSEKEYNEYKEKYKGDTKANISFNDEAYLTQIKVDSGLVDDSFKSNLEKKYKGYKLVK